MGVRAALGIVQDRQGTCDVLKVKWDDQLDPTYALVCVCVCVSLSLSLSLSRSLCVCV